MLFEHLNGLNLAPNQQAYLEHLLSYRFPKIRVTDIVPAYEFLPADPVEGVLYYGKLTPARNQIAGLVEPQDFADIRQFRSVFVRLAGDELVTEDLHALHLVDSAFTNYSEYLLVDGQFTPAYQMTQEPVMLSGFKIFYQGEGSPNIPVDPSPPDAESVGGMDYFGFWVVGNSVRIATKFNAAGYYNMNNPAGGSVAAGTTTATERLLTLTKDTTGVFTFGFSSIDTAGPFSDVRSMNIPGDIPRHNLSEILKNTDENLITLLSTVDPGYEYEIIKVDGSTSGFTVDYESDNWANAWISYTGPGANFHLQSFFVVDGVRKAGPQYLYTVP